MNARASAGGIVIGPMGKIVLVEQHGNSWSFPKGGIEAGESERDAAVREIAEETGLNSLEYVCDLGSYVRRSIGRDGTGETEEWPASKRTFFLFKTQEKDFHEHDPHGEITAVRWVTFDEATVLLTHPKDKEFLSSVRSKIEEETV
jgi:8-oxo-dGTP pyrophosphatase MutT (NUDIX family)